MEAKSADFISLRDAALTCGHSQEYLNLLACKGYLKAVKIGRNWVTTQEWLQNYSQRVMKKKTHSTQDRAPMLIAEVPVSGKPAPKNVAQKIPPKNLPAKSSSQHFALSLPTNRFAAFACFIIFSIVLMSVMLFSQEEILTAGFVAGISRVAMPQEMIRFSDFGTRSKNLFASLEQAVQKTKDFFSGVWRRNFAGIFNFLFRGKTEIVKISETELPAIDKTVLQNSADVLEGNLLGDAWQRMDEFRAEFGLSIKNDAETAGRGMVVVPLSGDGDEELIKAKIQESFSDEITIDPTDENSGIITPRFKDRDGGGYMYMMVPVNGK